MAAARGGSARFCGPCAVLLLLLLWGACAEHAAGHVVTVADANWTVVLRGEWIVKFYAPWCPACQHLHTDWESLGRRSGHMGISVGRVDVTQQPGLSGRFLVTTLPTIYHAKDGTFRRYVSSRTLEEIQAYVENRKWASVEPVAGWKSPSSLLMSGMATLFRLSVWIRQLHTYLTSTVGLPPWGSYLMFVVITLFLGLMLGLMLVTIADWVRPARAKRRETKAVVIVREEVSEGETEDVLQGDSDSDPSESSVRRRRAHQPS